MNSDIKRVISRMKDMQGKLQDVLKSQEWVEEARRYAEKQGHEMKKLFSSDLGKVKTFIEKERKELERFQKQIPGEVEKFKTLLKGQRKELERLLGNVRKAAAANKTGKTRSGARKKSGSKRSSASHSA